MATMRTPEEQLAIAERCIELEQEGGDILGYLWSENYISPRATWCRIQREMLHRKPYEFTDGKPVKGVKKMKHFKLTPEIRAEAIRLAIAGEDPREYLTKVGSDNAPKKWAQIRSELRDSDPETYGKLPARIGSRTKKASGTISADVAKKSAVKPLELEAGTNYQISVAEVPEKPKKPITQPLVYDGMTVREIEGLFGRYRRTDINGLVYVDFENPDRADILSYTVDQWKKLRIEQEDAFRILGVEL